MQILGAKLQDKKLPKYIRGLIGAIQYGNGKVILDASYWVDDNHALNDMLFYNFIKHGSAEITKTLKTGK